MRIHFGVSKFISIKKLIYILGALFVGLLAFLGATEQAFADSVVSGFKWCSYASDTSYQFIRFTKPSREITDGLSTTGESTFKYGCSRSDTDYAWSQFNNSKYYSLYSIQDNNYNSSYDVYKTANIGINVSNLCANYDNTNSIDFFIPFRSNSVDDMNSTLTTTPFSNHYGTITEIGDIMDFTVSAIYSDYTGEERECYISSNGDDSVEYDLNCLGVPYSDEIIGYNFKMYNKYYFNFQDVSNVFYLNNYNSKPFSNGIEFRKTIDYQCSYVEPQPSDNSIGDSNIDFGSIENDGSSVEIVIPGTNLDISVFDNIEYPSSILTIINYPIQRIQDFFDYIENPNHFCAPIRIDFSSITRAFGGGDYVLSIPCLRGVLMDLLDTQIIGSITLYSLIDLMMAFVLFLELGFTFYHLILKMLAGDSLTDFLIGKPVRPHTTY